MRAKIVLTIVFDTDSDEEMADLTFEQVREKLLTDLEIVKAECPLEGRDIRLTVEEVQ